MKGHWASLREIRLHLNGNEEIQPDMELIKSCCILHNILSQIEDSWIELDNELSWESPQRHPNDPPSSKAIYLQRLVKERCVAHNHAGGLLLRM
ncbi:hypothetical protein O181_066345 [Austropuccinia psidii MF-1]|uniref:DDE Tnp4 domain-containing protein n=1 Tax=Austropuccinia psidii MF-1 TaxID=1389203 RepID=A0A9Q3I514_9BASI|nr:hypothetical protein [Austropuccinia psidii MF-1]